MKFSRREFLESTTAIALAQALGDKAEAYFPHGYVPPIFGKSVLNSDFNSDWLSNQAKTISISSYGSNSITSNINSDGYPVGTLVSSISGQMYFDNTYFGHNITQWTAVGQFSFTDSDGIIVYSGGAGVYGITPSASGFYGGNPAFVNQSNQTTGQNIEWAWGTLILSVTTSGGWVQFGLTTNYASCISSGGSNPLSISSIVGNGTTATVTTSAPHGFPTGVTIVMDILGNTPSGFNVFGAICTITGASTFTYSNSTNATASVLGTWSGYSRNVQFNNLTGIPAATTFKVWRCDATNILVDQSAAYAGLVSVTGTGGPGTQTEVITSGSAGTTVSFPATIPVYGAANYTMSNLIICKKSELSNIQAGNQFNSVAINFVKTYKPKFIRYMDALAAQSYYSDFNYRMPLTYLNYGIGTGSAAKIIVPSLVAAMSGTGDAIQVTNPGYQTGSYVDGEIVQWTCNSSATGSNSTIQLGTRGTVPLFVNDYCPFHLTLTGSITNGDVITTTFTASYLPGGVRAVSYTVNTGSNGPAGVPDTSLQNLRANLNANLVNDAVLPAFNFQFGNNANPSNGNLGNIGVIYAPNNGAVTITTSVIGAGTEVWTGGYYGDSNSGLHAQTSGTTYTGIYNAIMGGFVVVNSGASVAGGLPAGMPIELVKELSIRCNVGAWFAMPFIYTATSWQSLGQWAYQNLGNVPVVAEYANEVWNTFANPWGQVSNVSMMLGFPGVSQYFYCGGYSYYGLQVAQLLPYFVTGYTGAGGIRNNCFIALMGRIDDISDNPSNSCTIDYRLNGLSLSTGAQITGASISGTTFTVPSNYDGLIAPSMVITGTGVTANTRIIKQITNTSSIGPFRGGTYSVTQSQNISGVTLTLTNPIYNAIGGVGLTSATDHSAFPNRPADICDTIGYAPYPDGGLIRGSGPSNFTGTASNFALVLNAALDWSTGDTTDALNAIDQDFNLGILPGGSFNSYCLSGMTNAHSNPGKIQTWENQIATYDGARPSGRPNISVHQYEGGKQQSLQGNQSSTGLSAAVAAMTSQFNNNGWTLSPTYGTSNASVAQNLVEAFLAYHVSTQYYNTIINNWLGAMATIHAARPNFCPAQFGIEGTTSWLTASLGVPIWGVLSGGLNSQELSNGTAFQAYNNS